MQKTLLPAIVALVSLLCSSVAEETKKPNIVLFLADDLGWTGLRSFGSDFYETPNLDQLAQEGMRFTDAYAACTVCSPTRASILTGKYPARLHLTSFIPGQDRPYAKLNIPDWTKGLEKRHETLPERLQEVGYRTIHVGKWHLNFPGEPVDPTQHGFDFSQDKPPGTKGYFINKGGREGYVTDYLADVAVEQISKKSEKPFFLYFAFHVPHTPIQGRADLVDEFSKKVDPEATHRNPVYAAMVKSMDLAVGRVLDALDESGAAENTVVVFTSDNGGLTQRYGKHDGFTENLPLRRGKGSAYEGGVRVPAIVRWPGVTKPGSESGEPVMTIDLLPTFAEAAGTGVPDGIDGKSLVPVLKEAQKTLERDLFWHFPHYHAGGDSPYSAIRSGNFRLIEFHESGNLELYHLGKDLSESKNLVEENPDKASELHRRLQEWREKVGAQMLTENPRYDPERATEVKRRGGKSKKAK
ncbi:MAG: sulfatase [Verrucomicrobiales bacterium]|nr:sulfatase [Verrucomicrobiales bacterium]